MEEMEVYSEYTWTHINSRGKQITVTSRANRPSEQALNNYAAKVLELFEQYEQSRAVAEIIAGAG